MKLFLLRVVVSWFLYKKAGPKNDGYRWCWYYSSGFDDCLDEVGYSTLISDAENIVDEELSYWSE